MKKILLTVIAMMLMLNLLAGCGKTPTEMPVDPTPFVSTEAPKEDPAQAPTQAPSQAATVEATLAETESDTEYEGDASSYYIDVV